MKNLATKLLKVQQSVGGIKKTSDNPFFNSKYFDINQLLSVLKPVLSANGLVLVQPLSTNEEGNPTLTTILIDSDSGEELTTVTPLMPAKDVQKLGASITYQRRYALQSLFALEALDDDGNVASGKTVAKKAPAKKAAKKESF